MISDNRLKTWARTRYWLLASALALTAVGLWPLITQVHIAEYDEAIFLDVARNIQTAGTPTRSSGAVGVYYFEHTPLYPYLLSPIIGQADERVAIARGLTAVLGLVCVGLVFLCGEQLQNTLAGFVAASLTAVNSFFLLYAYFVTMETVMAVLLLLSLYCLIRSEVTGARRRCLLAGLALAGAVLAKEMALGLAVAYFVYGVFFSRWRNRAQRVALLISPALIALLAWALWAWTWSPAAIQAALRRWFTSAAVGGTDFRMQITAAQWSEKLGGDLLSWGVSALFLVSLYFYVKATRQKPRAILVPLVYVWVAVVFSYLMQLKELRHLIAVVPMAALVIGIGVSQLLADLRVRRARVASLLVGLVVIIVVVDASPVRLIAPGKTGTSWLDPLYAYRLQENDRYYGALRSAGLYLAEHTPAKELLAVVHEGPVVSFYANRHYLMLYVLSFETIIKELAQIRYLIYDHRVFTHLNESQMQEVETYIRSHFGVETEITENGRTVTIYRNEDLP